METGVSPLFSRASMAGFTKYVTTRSPIGKRDLKFRMIPSNPRMQEGREWRASCSSLTANSRNNKSIGPWEMTSLSKRKAPVVEQVEEIPALINLNFVCGNLFFRDSIIMGRYPSISVIEPPMNATRPVFSVSNITQEFCRDPRRVIFLLSKAWT